MRNTGAIELGPRRLSSRGTDFGMCLSVLDSRVRDLEFVGTRRCRRGSNGGGVVTGRREVCLLEPAIKVMRALEGLERSAKNPIKERSLWGGVLAQLRAQRLGRMS